MNGDKINWFKIAANKNLINWQQNNLAVVEVNGKKITIVRAGENILACAYKCPHAGGILSEGFIDATGIIICPLHGYKFNLQNGRNTSGEGYKLKIYEVEIKTDGVFIRINEKEFDG